MQLPKILSPSSIDLPAAKPRKLLGSLLGRRSCCHCAESLQRVRDAEVWTGIASLKEQKVEIWSCASCSSFSAYAKARLSLRARWCPNCMHLSRSFRATLARESSYLRKGRLLIELVCNRCDMKEHTYSYLPLRAYCPAGKRQAREPFTDPRNDEGVSLEEL